MKIVEHVLEPGQRTGYVVYKIRRDGGDRVLLRVGECSHGVVVDTDKAIEVIEAVKDEPLEAAA